MQLKHLLTLLVILLLSADASSTTIKVASGAVLKATADGAAPPPPPPPPPPGGPAFINGKAGGSADGNVAITGAVNMTGASIFAYCTASLNGSSLAITDNQSNGAPTARTVIGANPQSSPFYKGSITAGASHTFTLTSSGNYPAIAVGGFSGVTAYHSEATGGTNSGTTVAPFTAVAPPNNSIAIACIAIDSAQTVFIDSGFTIIDQALYTPGQNYGVAIAYKIFTSSATGVKPTANWGATASARMTVFVLN